MNFNFNTKIDNSVQRSTRKLVLVLVAISMLMPVVTHAGLWSSVASIFSDEASAQSEAVIETNSQNMSLPEPATNINPSSRAVSEVIIDGGEALLPEIGPSGKAPEKIDNSSGQISTYIVRSGDSIAEIAKMYDVSANTIMWANDMTKASALKVGQTLVILPISGVRHTVVSGDTLGTIAKKYQGDIDEISSFNDLKSTDKLSIGDTLVIPDGLVSSSIRPSATSKYNSSKIVSSGPVYDGYYMKPFIGGTKTQGIHGYNGVDYGIPIGSQLYAAAAGTVLISKNTGYNGGYGNYVVIKHSNGTQTVYAHMNKTAVSVGQAVTQGQLIGYSGNTGRSTGPHIHFEVRGAKNPF